MMFPDGFIQELKSRVDMVQLISEYTTLRRTGSDTCKVAARSLIDMLRRPQLALLYMLMVASTAMDAARATRMLLAWAQTALPS